MNLAVASVSTVIPDLSTSQPRKTPHTNASSFEQYVKEIIKILSKIVGGKVLFRYLWWCSNHLYDLWLLLLHPTKQDEDGISADA